MLKVSKERILAKLNNYSREALKRASEMAIEQNQFEVTVSHLLLAMMEQPGGDIGKLLSVLRIQPERLEAKLRKSLDHARRGAQDLPEFATLLLELLQDALMLGSGELEEETIRTGTIFAAIAQNPDRYCHFYAFSEFEALDSRAILAGFYDLVKGSMEGNGDPDNPANDARNNGAGAAAIQSESALAKFGRNMTEQAKNGEIDPVFCRDTEIAQMTDILSRRRKNNPILVGDPGVGKTALAEGLALKIIESDVPAALQGAALWELDLGALQAGASVKGEFERRLKAVLDEVISAPEKIVLFIDEAHTLIGGGAAAGSSDAANLLKPALARGQIRAIAATTWSEYKKYFEKDAALTRRFQLIKLAEPTIDQCVTILRGLRPQYEKQHNVYISDVALHAAASLSVRYLTGRQLPDKAFDVLDTAAVRVAAGQSAQPRELDWLNKRIMMLERELSDRDRDSRMAAIGALAGSDQIEETIARLKAQAEKLQHRWQMEKQKVDRVIELRTLISDGHNAANDDTIVDPVQDDDAAETSVAEVAQHDPDVLRAEIVTLLAELRDARRNETALVEFEVGEAVIADVISDWTGVPASAMSDDDADRILGLGDALRGVIKGQDLAIDVIHDRMKAARLDLVRDTAPRGVFLLVGPSGVGKTETAEQVALHLFGGRQFLSVINMSEYQEKHTVSRLIGSPPGYVGYGEGGILTEAIRKMPYSVVLLDEVEKAHPDVMNIFYQGFDKGVINDGEGREIDCRNVVFFMTSNLGSDALMQNRETVEDASMEALEKALRPHLQEHFKPALLARMRILCFKPLSSESIRQIIDLKLNALAHRLQKVRGLELSWNDNVLALIEDLCSHADNGARMVEQVIDRWILPSIAEEALQRISLHASLDALELDAADGGFVMTFLPELETAATEQADDAVLPEKEARAG
ncbi:type VI secretion system ATPase TssH [Thalassospira sp. MCCC 1A01428]|uniref:type VI secretion system ATPase TssH n=1 Tax=Thalassospira sp. MCCC 1A01428 TaxID=1470575 RepID=UPI000A1E8918|nr:type VI secretion system ATPase TssH [Thalassospira sp. MCCC 1A01428]